MGRGPDGWPGICGLSSEGRKGKGRKGKRKLLVVMKANYLPITEKNPIVCPRKLSMILWKVLGFLQQPAPLADNFFAKSHPNNDKNSNKQKCA